MPLPRFKDEDGRYDVYLMCECHWCWPKDTITKNWKECPHCGGKFRTARIDFDPPYQITYADGRISR